MFILNIYASGFDCVTHSYTYTDNLIDSYEIEDPELHTNVDWSAVVGIDYLGIDDFLCNRDYDYQDVLWSVRIYELLDRDDDDDDGDGYFVKNLIWEQSILESEIVKDYIS